MNGQCLKDITSGKSFDIFLECVDKEVGKYICRKRQTHACNGHLVYIAFPLPVRASPLSPSQLRPLILFHLSPAHMHTHTRTCSWRQPHLGNPIPQRCISLHGWRCMLGLGLAVGIGRVWRAGEVRVEEP